MTVSSRLMLILIESLFVSLHETSLTQDFPFFSLVQELMKDRHKKLSNLVVQFTSIVNEDELPGEILVTRTWLSNNLLYNNVEAQNVKKIAIDTWVNPERFWIGLRGSKIVLESL